MRQYPRIKTNMLLATRKTRRHSNGIRPLLGAGRYRGFQSPGRGFARARKPLLLSQHQISTLEFFFGVIAQPFAQARKCK
jgi:hypothetical protein